MNIINAEKRDPSVKARKLRRFGIAPCVIYGGSLAESLSVQIDQNTARQLQRVKREGSTVKICLDGRVIPAQIKNIERDVTNSEVIHISFQALSDDKRVNCKAGIVLQNRDKAPGVLEQMLYEVPYTALPADIFDIAAIDLSDLKLGDVVTVGDIPAFQNDRIELRISGDSIVVRSKDRKRSNTPE